MAHGPPISASGAPPPIVTPPIRTARVGMRRLPLTVLVERRLDERREERVRLPWTGSELRVELAGHEPGMIGQLDDLDELLLRPDPGDAQPALLEVAEVVVVHLVAVPVALADDALPIRPRGRAALVDHDRVEAEAHRAPFVADVALLGQQVDHVVGRGGIELRRVRPCEPTDMARVLDHRALHPEADAEVRDVLLARVADRLDLALD